MPVNPRCLNAVAGTWMVDEGQIIIDGIDVTKLSEHKRAAYLGRVFQDPMTGTAATMGIEETLPLQNAAEKTRFLKPGITKKEREEYKELLKILGHWTGRSPYFQSRTSLRWTAPGTYSADGNPPETKASAPR